MSVATAFVKQPEPAQASPSGQNLVAFGQCPLCSCSLGLYRTLGKGYLQFKALIFKKGPVLLGGLGMTVCLFMGLCALSGAPGPQQCPTAATSSQLAASVFCLPEALQMLGDAAGHWRFLLPSFLL